MPIHISFDGNNSPELPILVLATKNGTKLGVLNSISNVVLTEKLSDASELSFTLHKELDGVMCHLWDDVTDFKLIWCKEWNKWFSIEVKTTEANEVVKDITAYSLGEYELSQILLFNTEINTEEDIKRDDYTSPTVLYDSEHNENSLLHRILSKAPHYRVSHVDETISRLQRSFSFNNKSIKDAFDEVAEEIGCLFVYDVTTNADSTVDRAVTVYDLEQTCLSCGYRGEFTGTCPKCGSGNIHQGYGTDTTVFISTDNLSQEVSYTTDAGSVKNCFHLTAGDELMTATVRACNPAGGNYIWYIPDEVRNDMSESLKSALALYDEKSEQYTKTKQYSLNNSVVTAYNNLVNKYSSVNTNLSVIQNPVIGYSSLIQLYYNVIDFGRFLQTTLMPQVVMEEKTAESQAALLTTSSLSPVAVSTLSDSTSQATAESAIKTIVRAIIDTSRFSFSIDTTTWSNPYWTGSITVTSRTEDEQGQYDSATSNQLTLTFTDDYATYLRQLIEKKMRAANTDDVSVSGLLSGTIESLTQAVVDYSYDYLSNLASCCQDVLNVIIDSGSTSQSSNLEEDIYTPYYNKLLVIQNEMDERAGEIEIICGSESRVKGLQQEIEEIRSYVQAELDLQSFLGDTLWLELCSYRREEEYANSNYISDGLTNAELIANALEYLEKAHKEIYKSALLQHSISSTLSNLLAIDEFKPLLSFFEVGNWIRARVDDIIYRLRLISYEIDFSNFSEIQVAFSDATRVIDGTSDVASVLNNASTMTTSFSYVKKQAGSGADSKSILDNWVANGLSTTQAKIVDSADDQNIVWDNHGMLFRRYNPITDSYEPQQLKIINSTMAITDDGWHSTKTAIGRFFYQDPASSPTQYVEAYGVNAETVVGKMILGQSLGIYNSTGSLKFDRNGLEVTNSQNKIVFNPGGTNLLKISKGTSDIFYLDSDGVLHIAGTGAGFTVSNSSSSLALSGDSFSWTSTNSSLTAAGVLTATGADIAGKITSKSGEIGGWNITDSAIYRGNSTFQNANSMYFGSSGLSIKDKFSVTSAGVLSATGATISGSITATSLTLSNGLTVGTVGTNNTYVTISSSGALVANKATISGTITAGSNSMIGPWKITDTKIYYEGTPGDYTVMMQVPTSNTTYVFAAGGTNNNSYADCPFRVDKTGHVYATLIDTDTFTAGGNISGWTTTTGYYSQATMIVTRGNVSIGGTLTINGSLSINSKTIDGKKLVIEKISENNFEIDGSNGAAFMQTYNTAYRNPIGIAGFQISNVTNGSGSSKVFVSTLRVSEGEVRLFLRSIDGTTRKVKLDVYVMFWE